MPNVCVFISSKIAPDWVIMGWKFGVNEYPGLYLYSWFWWHLVTRFISGAQRMCFNPINIYARFGDLWSEMSVQKSTRNIISLSIHKILMTFCLTLHLWYRTKLHKVHQNLPPTGWLMGLNWGEKSTLSIISLSVHSIPMKFGRTIYLGCRTQVSIKPYRKSAARLGVVDFGVKKGFKSAHAIYLLIYEQGLNE